jgi:hypothetical protein
MSAVARLSELQRLIKPAILDDQATMTSLQGVEMFGSILLCIEHPCAHRFVEYHPLAD